MLGPTAMMFIGFVVGAGLGLLLASSRFGCLSLLSVPVGVWAYVSWWQSQHPELLRSTSGLDYLFAQFPPLIGALAGYGLVAVIRHLRE